MATCDPSGRIAQMLADMHACLVMDMSESLRDAQERFDAAMRDAPDVDPTTPSAGAGDTPGGK